jgi:hypothetical protein
MKEKEQGKKKGEEEEEEAIDVLPKNLVYFIIGLVVLFTSTRLIKAGPSHIFSLMLGYLIIVKLREKEKEGNLSFNEKMDYRNELLSAPSHFHLDANLINLFYSIFGWREKNANNFDHAVAAVNNILKIESDTEKDLERCVDNYEIAFDQSKIALNMIHGFVYTLDHPLLIKKLKKVLVRLQQLLERHLQNIRDNCEITEEKKATRDVNSRFIEDSQGPKPFDGDKMSQFDYY